MQCSLGDQGIVVVLAEHLRALQRADDEGNGLQLSAALRDAVLVHGESLYIEVIGEVFESALVRYLSGQEEETESYRRRLDRGC